MEVKEAVSCAPKIGNKKKVKLIVAYDGTNYCGWQVQPNGVTVAEKINEALTALLGEEISVTGASRTDAGVHSLGNVCTFETTSRMPAEKISFALNTYLPDDIAVQDSCEVPMSFHPRFSKSWKTYEYRILNCTFPNPCRRLDTLFYHYPLDVQRMNQAAGYLVGEHDFKSFASIHTQSETTVRTISDCTVTMETGVIVSRIGSVEEGQYTGKNEGIITIRIRGNGFLYNMVRIIAGTLIEVGSGRREPEDILRVLAATDRSAAGPTAPAHGLTMMGIEYE